jgi:hypothetical protein
MNVPFYVSYIDRKHIILKYYTLTFPYCPKFPIGSISTQAYLLLLYEDHQVHLWRPILQNHGSKRDNPRSHGHSGIRLAIKSILCFSLLFLLCHFMQSTAWFSCIWLGRVIGLNTSPLTSKCIKIILSFSRHYFYLLLDRVTDS